MKTITVSGLLAESLQGQAHYYVDVDLQLNDAGKIINVSPSLLPGPRPWPPTGDYKLVYFHADEQHVEQVHINGQTWQQAVFGAVQSKVNSDERTNKY
jgi:hypothetical protein